MTASPDRLPPALSAVHSLERLTPGRLSLQKEGLGESTLPADLEGPEVLVPETLGCIRIGLTPFHEPQQIFLGDRPLLEPDQEMLPESLRKTRPLDLRHYAPKMSWASSSLSRSDSAGSAAALKRRARARKRSLSFSLVLRPVSMRSTSTRLALILRVFARVRTRLATRGGRETLWRTDDSVRFIRERIRHSASACTTVLTLKYPAGHP